MEIEAAGKDVGAGQAFETELCAVGAATDGLDLACHPSLLDGTSGNVDNVFLAFELLLHVVVLVANVGGDDAFAIAFLKDGDQVLHMRCSKRWRSWSRMM